MKKCNLTPRTAGQACWLLFITYAATTPLLQAEEPTQSKEVGSNYIVVNATGVSLDGSETAWRARQQRTSNFQGGIERLHYETALKKDWFMEMDGHGILDESDYGFELLLKKNGFNQTRIGFETFRTWSDARSVDYGTSGLPTSPFDPMLGIDRSKFFFETTFTPEEELSFTFRYTLRSREGKKASTSWEENNDVSPKVNTIPTFLEIDETHHIVELESERDSEQTDWGASLRWDHSEHENAYRGTESPPNASSHTVQEEEMENDQFSGHVSVGHRVNEQLTLNAAGLVSHLEGDVLATRIRSTNSFYPNVPAVPYKQTNVDFDFDQYVATFSALYQPNSHWVISPSIRFEKIKKDANGIVNDEDDAIDTQSDDRYKSITAEIGARYLGFKNWTLYGDLMGASSEGKLDELGGSHNAVRETDYQNDKFKFTVGANWNAHKKVTVAFQAYHKLSKNDYDHIQLESNDGHEGLVSTQDSTVNDFNIRVNWRILPNLTSISRFDYQQGTIDTQSLYGKENGFGDFESADHERFVYSESLSLQATQRLSIFGSINYVQDTFSTPASDAASSRDTALIAESQMDYFTAQISATYIYDAATDITVSATTLLSDNSYDNSAVPSVPYGNNMEEFTLTASVGKWLTPNKKVTLGYGYYDYQDDYMGAAADFTAHVITAKYEYRF